MFASSLQLVRIRTLAVNRYASSIEPRRSNCRSYTVTEEYGRPEDRQGGLERVDLPRDWFFYTYRVTVVETDRSDPPARRLILFTFAGAYQDYRYWLTEVPYLPASKYGAPAGSDPLADNPLDSEQPETEEEAAASSYMLNDTIAEGCIEAAVKVAPT